MKTRTKSKLSLLLATTILLASASGFTACGKKSKDKDKNSYKVKAEEFFFSTDNGKHYGNGRVEFSVEKTVYMKVVVYIESSDGEEHDVSGTLTIPKIKSVDAHYLKGQKITPEEDEVNGITTYPFEITTNEEWTFLFEFIPNEVGKIKMDLSFDDSIAEKYDMTNTIKIVKDDEIEDEDDDDDEEDDEETKKDKKKKDDDEED